MHEHELILLMKEIDDGAEPLPKDVKWVMLMADVNGDAVISAGKAVSCTALVRECQAVW